MSMQQGTGGRRREEKPPGKVQNQHVTLRSSSCVCWTMIDGVETGESDAGRESSHCFLRCRNTRVIVCSQIIGGFQESPPETAFHLWPELS
jgi:hypothetical protein